MNDTKNLEKKDWICNNPTEDEIRFNDDSDVISSDNSDIEKSNSTGAKRYNELLPRGKIVQKLLHSIRLEGNTSWRKVEFNVDLLNKYTEGEIRFKNRSDLIGCNNSDIKARLEKADKLLDSTICKGNTIWKTVESNVELLERYSETELETVSSRRMAKSQKRKHEGNIADEEEARSSKKIKTNNNKSVAKRVKRKENSHNVSCSEDEGFDISSSRISKGHGNIIKPNRNSFNTHLLSSESDNAADVSYDFTPSDITSGKAAFENGEGNADESEFVESSEEEVDCVEKTVKKTSNKSDLGENLHRKPKFTHEFNEEISKFSCLIDENLIKKNDIWILQCPSDMDCTALVGQRLSLGGSCQLEDGDRSYETHSYRNTSSRSATLAVPSERNHLNLCRIPITGSIIVEETVKPVKNSKSNEMIPEPPSRVELPENLRTRHPLLGIDFSKQPRTIERVAESLSKKKKHSKKHGESFNGVTVPDSSSSSISTPVKKKKKKRDRSSENLHSDQAEQLLEESVEDSAGKRKKKKKHKDNSFD